MVHGERKVKEAVHRCLSHRSSLADAQQHASCFFIFPLLFFRSHLGAYYGKQPHAVDAATANGIGTVPISSPIRALTFPRVAST